MAPVVDRLGQEHEGAVEVVKLNVETDAAASETASRYGVRFVPTFVLLKADGTVAETLIGEQTEQRLRDAMEAAR